MGGAGLKTFVGVNFFITLQIYLKMRTNLEEYQMSAVMKLLMEMSQTSQQNQLLPVPETMRKNHLNQIFQQRKNCQNQISKQHQFT